MVDYADSSQLNAWLYKSPDELSLCRLKANQAAKKYLTQQQLSSLSSETPTDKEATESASGSSKIGATAPPVENFASGLSLRLSKGEEPMIENDDSSGAPAEDAKGNPYITPEEEATLVSFYVSKLPSLIGPKAQVPRLRRESKVTATAALLLRRFFLSNSVMLFDPKTFMVAAAFLGSKVEDAMADVRYLEEGTVKLNAPVSLQEIITAETLLLQGTHFDLLCFHPYKAVLALTEDLRTYLKSDKGKALVQSNRPLSGQDLKPIYDKARELLDDVVVSDIPLLYNPGQVGLASLMVAQEQAQEEQQQQPSPAGTGSTTAIPWIDLMGYLKQRFEGEFDEQMEETVKELCGMLRELKDGKHGCDNYRKDMTDVKAIHKKLKKVRVWGHKKETKKKKRDKHDQDDGPDAKRQKKS